jgi:hypothetical protein
MIGSVAVTRIKDGMGFISGTAYDARILLRLQEAQRDLEKGKTIPEFLLIEDAIATLAAAAHTVAKPTGFMRMKDTERFHFVTSTSDAPVYLTRKYFDDAQIAQLREDDTARSPSVYVVRKTVFDFITTADVAYTLTYSYYKNADVIALDVENLWLANAADWIIGKAGKRLALDARNKSGVDLFTMMEQEGRAAVFGEDIASEDADGPVVMGGEG